MRVLMTVAILGLTTPAFAQPVSPPDRAAAQAGNGLEDALLAYMRETDLPETFGETRYRLRGENLIIDDITGDGAVELIAHVYPYYRQSATILIYRLTQEGGIERVTEGLAPGPLVPVSGELIDSHWHGDAADLTILSQTVSGAERGIRGIHAQSMASGLGGFVAYAGFFHVDSRAGPSYYIDMTGAEIPSGADSCEGFEFSPVRQIETGFVSGLPDRPVLGAWAGDAFYFYEISGVSADGYLEKRMWVVPATEDSQGLSRSADGRMMLLDANGAAQPLAFACDGEDCRIAPEAG